MSLHPKLTGAWIAIGANLDVDIPHDLVVEQSGKARAEGAQAAAKRQAGKRRLGRGREAIDRRDEDDLDVPSVNEAVPDVERTNVGPGFRNSKGCE